MSTAVKNWQAFSALELLGRGSPCATVQWRWNLQLAAFNPITLVSGRLLDARLVKRSAPRVLQATHTKLSARGSALFAPLHSLLRSLLRLAQGFSNGKNLQRRCHARLPKLEFAAPSLLLPSMT